MAFRDAVVSFCSDDVLQYQWTKYLPSASISDPFWAQLRPIILSLLKDCKILKTRGSGLLKLPSDVRFLRGSFLDRSGNPLLADLEDEVYLAPQYDLTAVKELKVDPLSFRAKVLRFQADLRLSPQKSRMKSTPTSDEWHTRVAKHLLLMLEDKVSSESRWMLLLTNLIPLNDGRWVSTKVLSCFFPDTAGVPIPQDLGLDLVCSKSIENASRKLLFTKIGVEVCVATDVVASIHERYTKRGMFSPSLSDSIAHLRYLFWYLPSVAEPLDKRIPLADEDETLVYRAFVTFGRPDLEVDDMYFESEQEFSAYQLLGAKRDDRHNSVPTFSVHFLHSAYLKAIPLDAHRDKISWKTWLERSADVRTFPRLEDRRFPSTLSEAFRYVVKTSADKLIELLREAWDTYEPLVSSMIADELGEACVPCQQEICAPLKEAYLPVSTLKRQACDFGVTERLPFLPISSNDDRSILTDWGFLETFGVGTEPNVSFMLDCLSRLVSGFQHDEDVLDRGYLTKVYEAIARASAVDQHDSIR